jgi:hypothetical protein
VPLTVNGRTLDTSVERFAELEPADDLLDDPTGLREAMDERGYLFFRGLLDPELILEARREVLLKYARECRRPTCGPSPRACAAVRATSR